MGTLLNPGRTVAELKELRALTGDENGAHVAFKLEIFPNVRGTTIYGLNKR